MSEQKTILSVIGHFIAKENGLTEPAPGMLLQAADLVDALDDGGYAIVSTTRNGEEDE